LGLDEREEEEEEKDDEDEDYEKGVDGDDENLINFSILFKKSYKAYYFFLNFKK
jgi:hypothetical protein